MKVLVVDDEVLVRRSLIRALARKGYEVLEASDGAEGLSIWKEHSPDVVFLDVLMPRLTGPEVLREIGDKNTAKVILMSAFTGEHNKQTAQEMGASLFVSKPFEDIFAVVNLIEELA